jgi:selenoprotein W-related protein
MSELSPRHERAQSEMTQQALPQVRITYCTQCQWLLRAGWMAQELLSTFGTDLGEVTLVPGTGGIFTISCNGTLVWDRKRDGGFPDAAKLKQLVRDVIDPDRDLGHADRKSHKSKDPTSKDPA